MGFCLFGVIGDCGDTVEQKSVIKKQMDMSTEIIDKKVQKVTTEMKANSVQMNEISCESAGRCEVRNVDMRQFAQLSFKGIADITATLKSDLVINELVDSAAKISLESFAGGVVGGRKEFTSTEIEAISSFKKQITSIVNQETFSSCASSIIQTNTIKIKATQGGIIDGINMGQISQLTSECVIKVFTDLTGKIQNDTSIKERLQAESKITSFSWATIAVGAVAVVGVAIVVGMVASSSSDSSTRGGKRRRKHYRDE